MKWFRRHLQRLGGGVAAAALLAVPVASATSAAQQDTTARATPSLQDQQLTIEQAMRAPVLGEPEMLEQLAGADEQERARLRTDMERLAAGWAAAGGRDGFPFWERAWRRYEAGELAGSALRDYTVAYRDVLVRSRGEVEEQAVQTDAARVVRDQLVRAIELRVESLGSLAEYLADKRPESGADAETLHEQLRELQEDLQASYRATRLAMNTSQAALAAAGADPLAEDAFL